MNTRIAEKCDTEILSQHDKHIRKEELESVISLGRVIVAEDYGTFIWLRWKLFWENTPFLNMLFLRSHWEKQMKEKGYEFVMTSSQAKEEAQHFYRKLRYSYL